MKVINDIVGKNLKIYQDDDFFKFSLESVLLPNFVNINLKDKKILDLCTGNAPIPLILSTKTKAKIYGVELQEEIYDLASDSVKLNNKEITEINSDNYANILQAVHDDLDSYVGMKIKITGYIYRLIDFEENQFVIARDMYINKEKTQSVVVGFLTQYKNAKNFKNGEWVELIGVIEKGKYHNEEIPIIKVTELEIVNAPEDSFVIHPSDTYIPTSGLL